MKRFGVSFVVATLMFAFPAAAQTPAPPATAASGPFRTDFYPTCDAKKIAETLREQAMKK